MPFFTTERNLFTTERDFFTTELTEEDGGPRSTATFWGNCERHAELIVA